ncbi:MAG: MFS transporter [Chloroflexi bacterium]|nr:MFS transporter [Chloroflexota bacterium]
MATPRIEAASPLHAYLALAALSAAVFLGALDQTVVVTALPSVIADLQVPFTRLNEAAWIVTAYLLGYTVAMPLVGRMSDVYGRRRVFTACLLLFGATSFLCGAARGLEWLILARGLQAVGGGALLPVTLAVVGDLVPERRRSLLLGAVGAAAEAGGVLGPLYGALLLDSLSWRWIFYLNLPLVLVLLGAVHLTYRHPSSGTAGSVDYPGALLLGTGLGSLTLGLSREVGQAGAPQVQWELVALAVVLLAAFVVWEGRAKVPLVDLALFHVVPFAAGNAASLLAGAALIVAMVDVPLWSATVLQRPAVEGGLLLMRLTVAIPVGALLGGLLARTLGYRLATAAGLGLSAAGLSLLAQWRPDTPLEQMTRDLALSGAGFGLIIAPLTAVVMAWAGPARAGVASALVTVMRMVGMTIGLSALTAWGLARFNALVANLPLPLPLLDEAPEALQQRLLDYQQRVLEATLAVFGEIFLAAALVCLLALVPALLLRGRDARMQEAEGSKQ